jgi:hypothetical protein
MSRVVSSLLVLVCTAFYANSARAIADDKIDISGGWNFEVDIAGNTGAPVFIFKQDGEKLTGTYRGQFGEAKVAGTVKGAAVEFSFEAQGGKVVYKGTAKKGTMAGEADYAGQASGTWKAAKIDVTGIWNVEIDLGGNSGTPVFTLKQEGEKLTGQYKGQFGEAEVTGKVKGDEVEFSFEFDNNKVVYKGKISKDAMKGEADYAGQATGAWTGKRKVEGK